MISPLIAADISLYAPTFAQHHPYFEYVDWLSNSIFVAAVVSLAVILLARQATRRMELVPNGSQNLFEMLIEALYDTLEGIVGKHMIKRSFGLLATLFIFILCSNWFALLPGVGSVGWGTHEGEAFKVDVPLLRPSTADLNMTLAMACFFMVMWFYWTIREIGIVGFLDHTFGVKGGMKGLMAYFLLPIFLFVGLIEMVSILFRPVSLSLRLFGNVFAGENLLTTMISIGRDMGFPDWIAYIASITVPIPFYFLELLIGLLQAAVFMLLCAVYLQLSTSHDEESH